MKILYVITGLSLGGAEKVVVNLADQMHQRGHEVKIAYLTGDISVRPNSSKVELIYLGMKSKIDFWRAFIKYQKLVREYCPDVVHSHMFHANIFARVNRLFCRVSKLVCTTHSSNEGGRLRMLAYRWTNWLSNLNTSVSDEARRALINKKAFTEENIITIYNGIDITQYSQTIKHIGWEPQKERTQFLSVGRFNKAKDYPNLLQAISKVTHLYKNVHFNIAGDGELRDEIEQLIIQLNLSEYVTLLGRRNDIPQLMRASDFFILSSAWEGFGLVVAEAMVSGSFVIATDCGGVKEVMGGYGILVPPRDSKALAEGIIQALKKSENELEINNQKAHQYVVDNFSLDKIVDKWIDIYSGKLL